MAFAFPLPLDQFFAGLPIASGIVDLGEAFEMSQTGFGEILTASLGNRLWKLDIEIASRDYVEGAAIKAKLDTLRYPGRSLICRASPFGPAFDPGGVILGASAVKISNVATNNRDITLTGLPPGYILNVGDFLSFQYGANPTRYALHQIVSKATSTAQGQLSVEVSSFVAQGWAVNTPVELIKPVFKAIVVPGSTDPGKTGSRRVEGIKFSVVQTFR